MPFATFIVVVRACLTLEVGLEVGGAHTSGGARLGRTAACVLKVMCARASPPCCWCLQGANFSTLNTAAAVVAGEAAARSGTCLSTSQVCVCGEDMMAGVPADFPADVLLYSVAT